MARLTDPVLLANYHRALINWSVEGYIEFTDKAHTRLRETLDGVTVKQFKESLYRYVLENGGEIDQVKEQREEWRERWEWHFDLRPTINGLRLYVETTLFPESFSSSDEPIIYIVQIKPA